MILERQVFRFKNSPLVERVVFETPFRYEAVFQNEGCFLFISGSDKTTVFGREKVQVNDQEAVLLNCGTYFVDFLQNTKNQQVEVFAFHLHEKVLKELYKNEVPHFLLESSHHNDVKRVIPENTILEFIKNLSFYFKNEDLVNDALLELKIKELMLLLVQTKNAPSIHELIHQLFSVQVINIVDVVNAHLFSNVSIEDLADLCMMSLSSFKRQFQKYFEESPAVYIRKKRLEKAKKLLLLDYSIADIAFDIGYQDASYFTRIFTKEVGQNPSEFRLNYKS